VSQRELDLLELGELPALYLRYCWVLPVMLSSRYSDQVNAYLARLQDAMDVLRLRE
jgi:hypothetical protein